MKMRPRSDCIVVKQHDEETKTASGLIIAFESNQKKFQGEVMAVGTGEIKDNGEVRKMEIKVGEIVLFGEYSGQKFKLDGQEYLMMREKDIIGVLDKEDISESEIYQDEIYNKFYNDNIKKSAV